MAELLKNKYNEESINALADSLKAAYAPFDARAFVRDVIDETWEALELKARMRQITVNLGKHLPEDYERALAVIDEVVAALPAGFNDFTLMYFPDFVELYGQDENNWDISMAALERYTASSTSEFAVRPFIIKHEARMMAQMEKWAESQNEHVRRLASEGCRPRLPWGQALESFKADPSPVLPILEKLKADPSLYVRKSVANNLNDISKSQPELVAGIAREWQGKSEFTDWIIKRACRTLLKKGDAAVLALFGFADADCVAVKNFALGAPCVAVGGKLAFSFEVRAKRPTKVRLEYGIDYMKANGKQSRKIFQIAEIFLEKNESKAYTKNHSFANFSTRKHYTGAHSVTLIVNGAERGRLCFELLEGK